MLNRGTPVAVRCRISQGGFSSERVFRVTLPEGTEHVGAAPVDYFFDDNLARLSHDQPAQRGTSLTGFLAGRVLDTERDGIFLVSFPSGEVLRVPAGEVTEHPKESRAHVPIQS